MYILLLDIFHHRLAMFWHKISTKVFPHLTHEGPITTPHGQCLLDVAGATTEDVVYLTTYVTTMEDHDINMTIREKFFKDPPPGRSSVVAKSMGQPGSLIEFHGVAVIDG